MAEHRHPREIAKDIRGYQTMENDAAEIARLTAERDTWKNEAMLAAARQGIDNYQRLLDERDAARSEIAALHDLHNQRGAAVDELLRVNYAERAGRERAERVAVWAVKHEARCGLRMYHTPEQPALAWSVEQDGETTQSADYDGTDADIYRALVEACEGGRDDG